MNGLNVYFWAFAIFAVLITPVALTVHICYDEKIDWTMQLYIAGIPVIKRKKREKPHQTVSLMARKKKQKLAFLLVRDGSAARLLRSMPLERVRIDARLSFEDAAATAMVFAFLKTLTQTLTCCGVQRGKLAGAVQDDFGGWGTRADVSCIFAGRLGRIGLAGAHLMISAAKAKAGLAAEEVKHAASH